MRNKLQLGFTLIELVVVLVIIAVMTAVALPRFASLQAQARIAKMNGALGSIKSAAVMSHALLLANGYSTNASGDPNTSGLPGPDISVEGVNAVYATGYPNAATILPLAGIGGTGEVTGTGVVGDYYVAAISATSVTLAPDQNHAGGASNCTITYTQATAATITPVYTNNLTEANCS